MPAHRVPHPAAPCTIVSACHPRMTPNKHCSRPSSQHSSRGMPPRCSSVSAASLLDMPAHRVPHPAALCTTASACLRRTSLSTRCSRPSCPHSRRHMLAHCTPASAASLLDMPAHRVPHPAALYTTVSVCLRRTSLSMCCSHPSCPHSLQLPALALALALALAMWTDSWIRIADHRSCGTGHRVMGHGIETQASHGPIAREQALCTRNRRYTRRPPNTCTLRNTSKSCLLLHSLLHYYNNQAARL
jgi:hypothetical protein